MRTMTQVISFLINFVYISCQVYKLVKAHKELLAYLLTQVLQMYLTNQLLYLPRDLFLV